MKSLALVVTLLVLACCRHAAAAERPNFLLIFTDDHGYGDVSAYHPSDVRTPNIDRIGAEGMLFTAMRANCTVCSPSRAALLTGRYADRDGVPGVIRTQPENSWGYFKPGVPTMADELRKRPAITRASSANGTSALNRRTCRTSAASIFSTASSAT